MKTAAKSVFCIVLIVLLLSSCTKSAKRINDLTIVQALAVDSEQNECSIGIQYLNLFANSGNTEQLNKNITSVTNGKGSNLSDAVFNASKTVSNDIFFGQNKLVIFGFDFAKNSIDSGIEYLLKSNESRPDVPVAIGIPDAQAIIKSKEKGALIPAENIYSLIRLGEENGHAPAVTVCDLLNLYNDETSDIFLPVLSTEKDNVKCEGTAVFSKNKFALFLNESETFGFLTVKNRFNNGVITFDVKNIGKASVRITSSKAEKEVKINNKKLIFHIRIKASLTVNETGKSIKSSLTENEIKAIQRECESKLSELCKASVEKCFENGCDPYMCARYLYIEDIDLYNSMKDNWRESLKDIEVSAEVDSKLQRVSNNTAKQD